MNIKLIFWAIDIVIILAFYNCISIDQDREKQLIKDLWENTSTYFAEGDWDNYSTCWDHSAQLQLIHPHMGEWLHGWEEFAPQYKDRMKISRTFVLLKNDLSINVDKNGEMAWGTADVIFEVKDTPGSKTQLWESVVFKKIDNKWKIAFLMAAPTPKITDDSK